MRSDPILYDADCGFCRWSLGVVLAWDRRGALRPVALQDPEADELLGDVPAAERMESWHLVTADGLASAGAAAAPLLRRLPGGRPLAALAARFPRATERGYRWIADNRSAFSRAVPRRAISRADRRIARRRA
ncbi:MAG: thiol-disulfide oxidoreductase DCC family protein [Thermoleophilaceae bacterium]